MKLINIPNIITCCNFLCGCMAIYFGINGFVGYACLCIIGGAFFDYFDGMTARALGISGPIGKELDSLADVVSFGIAPAILAFDICLTYCPSIPTWLPFVAFMMAAFSALRLAKFNCDERQALSFIGLPTPANALLWIGLTYVNQMPVMHDALSAWVYIVILALCSWLLISELPMFSLKIKPGHNSFAENKARYIFLVLTLLAFIVCGIIGKNAFCASPAYIIAIYLILSIIDVKVFNRNK